MRHQGRQDTPTGGDDPSAPSDERSTSKQSRRVGWGRLALRWGVQAAVVLLVYLAVQGFQTRKMAEGQAPPLAGVDVTGQARSLSALQGEPTLVYFWATWCTVCKVSDGAVDKLMPTYQVLTVASQSGDATSVRAYLGDRAASLPTLLDPDGRVARAWGVTAFPSVFVVSASGRVSQRTVGLSLSWPLRLRMFFARFT